MREIALEFGGESTRRPGMGLAQCTPVLSHRHRHLLPLLGLLGWACANPELPPTDGDAVPEAHVSAGDLVEWERDGEFRVSPRLDAPAGATRVGLLLVVQEGHEGEVPRIEARGLDADGTPGPWRRVRTTWSEERQQVSLADLDIIAWAAQIRIADEDAALIGDLLWSAVVPVPEGSPDEFAADGDVASQTQALRAELRDMVRPRSAWGARAPRSCSANASKHRMAIHHTVTPAQGDPASRIRGMQNFHMDTRGWCDIGYHFMVSLDGTLWEGRPLHLIGTHVGGHNTGNIGISFIGCFQNSGCSNWTPFHPPDVMINAAGRLVRRLGGLYGIPINSNTVRGHRDHSGATTSCPGNNLHARLGDIRAGTPPPECSEGASRSCGSNVGECVAGTQRCVGGRWGSCSGAVGPRPERCNGRDDDCDGRIDNGLTRRCGSDVGECVAGTQTCRSGDWGTCVGEVRPRPEECNGRDDDCDGRVDNDLVRTCGSDVGECVAGTQVCSSATWGECAGEIGPSPEVCDGRDNSCDGQIDSQQVCEIEEATLFAHVYSGGDASSDVDGDGRADACVRGASGFECHVSASGGFVLRLDGPGPLSSVDPEDELRHASLRMADIDGDGRADLCAWEAEGLVCWLAGRGGFHERIVGPALEGSDSEVASLRLADLDGDGRADLCVRSVGGLECWRSTGRGFEPGPTLSALSDAAGFDDVSRYATIRLGDVNGDGRADVCARAAEGMRCWLSDGRAFGRRLEGPAWSDDAGFTEMGLFGTIRLADVDGDGRADLCARTPRGFACQLSDGERFGELVMGPALADEDGWDARSRYATLRLGDVDGDGRADLCGRSGDGVRCWLFTGRGFDRLIVGPELDDARGWDALERFGSLRLADVNGDGRADLCAAGAEGLDCWISDGAGFPRLWRGPRAGELGEADARVRAASLRIASPATTAPATDHGGTPSVLHGSCAAGRGGAPHAGLLAVLVLWGLVRRRRRS